MLRRLRAFELSRLLLLASLLGPALIFVLLAWWTYDVVLREAKREIAWTSEVARQHAAKVFDSFRLASDRIDDLVSGTSDTALRSSEKVYFDRISNMIRDLPQIESLIVLGRDARPLISTAAFPTPASVDFADRDYFQALKSGAQTYISKVQVSRIDGKIFFGWGRSRKDADGAFNGVIDLAVSRRFFMRFYETLISEVGDSVEGRVVTMARDDGQILVRYPVYDGGAATLPPQNAYFTAIRANPEAGLYRSRAVTEPEAPLHWYAYRKVPGHPVYILAGRSIASILAVWERGVLRYLAVGVPGTAAIFLLTLFTLRGADRERLALLQVQDEMRRREHVEEELRHAQKMEAVGLLTGGLAHDFNNIITGISGSLELAGKRIAQGRLQEVDRYFGHAVASTQRAAALTHRLLAFARRQPLAPKVVRVDGLILSLEDLLRRTTLGEAVTLDIAFAAGLWQTLCDPHQLENALLNLCINARDAMPEGGRITIAATNIRSSRAPAVEATLSPGDYVALSVTDTGTGMPAEVAARAFEPFFTTKPPGEGTGLGLSMIYGFARQSGGLAVLRSTLAKGTTVTLFLPRFAGETSQALGAAQQASS
jgi:signal transduction histidine kinase